MPTQNPTSPRTRQLTPAEVIPLRHEVLRPGRPRETAIFAGDDDARTTHWGALDPAGEIRAVATLIQGSAAPEGVAQTLGLAQGSAPASGDGSAHWQIRGMASSPRVRGQGYGAAVLRAAIAYAAARSTHATGQPGPGSGPSANSALIWCNARVAALDFYRAHGFVCVGPEFEIAGVGPHYVMGRRA